MTTEQHDALQRAGNILLEHFGTILISVHATRSHHFGWQGSFCAAMGLAHLAVKHLERVGESIHIPASTDEKAVDADNNAL